MSKVYNRKNKDAPEGAVYVGRPTRWGNPFKVGVHGDRDTCVRLFRESCRNDAFIEIVRKELKGKDLVCWCAPEACHADVLLKIANSEENP